MMTLIHMNGPWMGLTCSTENTFPVWTCDHWKKAMTSYRKVFTEWL